MARIKDQGIVVLAVGVTDQVDESLLKRLVTSDDYYFKVGNFGSLGQILDKVISQACVTIVPPKPTLPAPAGNQCSSATCPAVVNISNTFYDPV